MPTSPGDYLRYYNAIPFDGVTGRKNIHLTGYRSSFKGDANTEESRKSTYYDLRNFILKRKRYKDGENGATHVFTEDGTMFSDLLKPLPSVKIDMSMLQAMFQGVGRPRDFRDLFRVIDVYLTRAWIDEEHFQKLGWDKFVFRDKDGKKTDENWYCAPWEVQHFADSLLGIDCRGFVGAYLNEQRPNIRDTKNDMSFSIDSYNKGPASFHINKNGGQFRRIDDPAEVRQGDIMIKCSAGGSRHVAMINRVGVAHGNRIWIESAESRGSTGLACLSGDLVRLKNKHQDAKNDRNWQHKGSQYNFILRPKV